MRYTPASIQRNIAVSAAAHILLFGTALVFAHYSGGLFIADRSVITVSLVGEDRSGGPAGRVMRQVKELLAVQDGDAAVGDRSPLEPASATPDAEGMARDAAPSERKGEALTAEQGAGNGNGPGASTAEGPADSPAEKRFGYSNAEWQLLQSSLERAKTYPRIARERGIEGTVLVRFRASPSGNIEQVDVVKSSGARILDEASIATVYRAAPVPYVNGWVEVPMIYVLK